MESSSGMAMARIGRSEDSEQSGDMGDNSLRCEHFDGGAEYDDTPRLRYIRRKFPEEYKELEVLRIEVVGRYVRRIKDEIVSSTRKYLSNVFIYRDAEQRSRMLSRLNQHAAGYPGKLLLWTDEGDHLHTVHDCPMSNGQCRCYFAKSEDFRGIVRSPMRKLKFISELDEIDWTNILVYFLLSKRESNSQIWIGGRLQRLPSSHENLRWRDLCSKSREILDRETEGIRHNYEEEQRHREDDQQSIRSDHGETTEEGSSTGIRRKRGISAETVPAKKSKFERISAQVHTLLNNFFVLPSNHIRELLVYDKEITNLFDPSNEKAYQASCDVFQRKFVNLKLHDLKEIYDNATPVFYANNVDPFVYYHNMDDSFNYCNDLLKFQYEDNEDEIRKFLFNVRDWFDLKGWEGNNKINALCVIGPPNSGKNYFWDMWASLAYNVGHIGRVNNKTNQFALQECFGRRFIIGNEVSMEAGAKEDFKKLCEGTAFNIRVKYQGDKIFTRAPVLLISNFELDICYDPHFRNVRLHTIRWNTCNMLKDSNKKPYPLCIFRLFEHYNVTIN